MFRWPDTGYQPLADNHRRFLCWWGWLLFGLGLGSRRFADNDLRDLEGAIAVAARKVASRAGLGYVSGAYGLEMAWLPCSSWRSRNNRVLPYIGRALARAILAVIKLKNSSKWMA
jgi:hypothetical protein